MAGHERHAWLVIYDISGPRRLARVARTMEGRAIRIQYSVFLGVWSQRQAEEALEMVNALLHPRKDDVRAYRLPLRGITELFGKGPVAAGCSLNKSGFGWLNVLHEQGPDGLADEIEKERGLRLPSDCAIKLGH